MFFLYVYSNLSFLVQTFETATFPRLIPKIRFFLYSRWAIIQTKTISYEKENFTCYFNGIYLINFNI